MATGTNHWKLGLFVVVGTAVLLTSLVILGARNWNQETVSYQSYFDESVQGLEVGSPVKFRGVSIGRVSAIEIAPDQRHVAVTSELTVGQLERLNLGGRDEARFAVPPDLRVQLSQTGITGVKFVLIDYFDAADYPPPQLPFAAPEKYIPAAASTLKNLESSVVRAADRFPAIAQDVAEMAARMNSMLAEVDSEKLPARTGETLTYVNTAMRELNEQLRSLDMPALSREIQQSVSAFNATLARVDSILHKMDGERGLLDSAQRGADSLTEVTRGAQSLGPELTLTLREVRSAARSIRRFTDALERDPDMLLKGRAQGAR